MPTRKTKAASSTPTQLPPQSKPTTDGGFFPFARYTSIVGVHTSLVAFTTLFLPQTSLLFTQPDARGTDRPQHQFLEVLTANPVSTLMWICGGIMLLQTWWGGWVRWWCFEYASHGTDTEVKLERTHYQNARFARLGEALMFTLGVSLLFHITTVLFGAPIASRLSHTFLLSLVLSFLTVFTPAYAMGRPSLAADTGSLVIRLNWTRLFAELSPRNAIERAMVYPAVGAIAGCWSGAIPIALDWDRPWQAWPLTPLFGSILGYILGSLWALVVSAVNSLAEEHIKSEQTAKKTT